MFDFSLSDDERERIAACRRTSAPATRTSRRTGTPSRRRRAGRPLGWVPPSAPWRSGYAAACKAVYTGSIPVGAFRGRVGSTYRGSVGGHALTDLPGNARSGSQELLMFQRLRPRSAYDVIALLALFIAVAPAAPTPPNTIGSIVTSIDESVRRQDLKNGRGQERRHRRQPGHDDQDQGWERLQQRPRPGRGLRREGADDSLTGRRAASRAWVRFPRPTRSTASTGRSSSRPAPRRRTPSCSTGSTRRTSSARRRRRPTPTSSTAATRRATPGSAASSTATGPSPRGPASPCPTVRRRVPGQLPERDARHVLSAGRDRDRVLRDRPPSPARGTWVQRLGGRQLHDADARQRRRGPRHALRVHRDVGRFPDILPPGRVRGALRAVHWSSR